MRSPIHLLLRVEGEHASCERSSGIIQEAAIVQNSQKPLHITLAEPVTEDSRKSRSEPRHGPGMEPIWCASIRRYVI